MKALQQNLARTKKHGLWNTFSSSSFLIPALAISLTCSRCSSGQQSAPAEDPVQGQAAAQESNTSLEDSAATPAQGEGVNNAVAGGSNFGNNGPAPAQEGDDLGIAPAPSNATATENLTATPTNVPINNAIPLNAGLPLTNAPPVNAAPAEAASVPAVDPAAPADAAIPTAAVDPSARAAASPFVNPQMNWPGKGKVKYVTRQITRHSSANGPVIGEFAQGEHPLVFQNGNWAELNDGSFVKGNGLSEKGVGYKKSK